MKKLLVLALVLAVSTIANATVVGLTLTGGVVGLNVTDGGDSTYAIGIMGPGELSGFEPTLYPVASADFGGQMAATFQDVYDNDPENYPAGSIGTGEIWVFADAGTPYLYPNGTWLTANLTLPVGYYEVAAFQAGATVVTAYQSDGTILTALESKYFVPEPVTVVLLGLGGLLIRRKVA